MLEQLLTEARERGITITIEPKRIVASGNGQNACVSTLFTGVEKAVADLLVKMQRKLPDDIAAFREKHNACGSSFDWTYENCKSMQDVWDKAPNQWLFWVATRPGVLSENDRHILESITRLNSVLDFKMVEDDAAKWLRTHVKPVLT